MVGRHDRDRARRAARAGTGAGLMLLGALGASGCSEPGQGTVQVAPEARKQIAPHVAAEPKGRGFKPAAGKSFSIKDRAVATAKE